MINQQSLQEASRLHKERLLFAALDIYDKLLETNPDFDLYLRKIHCLRLIGYFEQALENVWASQKLKPDAPEIHYLSGVIFKEMGRNAEAIQSLLKVLQLHPHVPEIHYLLGTLYEQEGQLKDSLRHYQEYSSLPGWKIHSLEEKINGMQILLQESTKPKQTQEIIIDKTDDSHKESVTPELAPEDTIEKSLPPLPNSRELQEQDNLETPESTENTTAETVVPAENLDIPLTHSDKNTKEYTSSNTKTPENNPKDSSPVISFPPLEKTAPVETIVDTIETPVIAERSLEPESSGELVGQNMPEDRNCKPTETVRMRTNNPNTKDIRTQPDNDPTIIMQPRKPIRKIPEIKQLSMADQVMEQLSDISVTKASSQQINPITLSDLGQLEWITPKSWAGKVKNTPAGNKAKEKSNTPPHSGQTPEKTNKQTTPQGPRQATHPDNRIISSENTPHKNRPVTNPVTKTPQASPKTGESPAGKPQTMSVHSNNLNGKTTGIKETPKEKLPLPGIKIPGESDRCPDNKTNPDNAEKIEGGKSESLKPVQRPRKNTGKRFR